MPVPLLTPLRPPRVDFDWTPKSGPVSITVAGNTYPYATQADGLTRASDARYASASTPVRTTLTFTANAAAFSGAEIILYHWKFGDGTEAYGQIVSKIYPFNNGGIIVTLTVRDTYGNEASAMKPLNLVHTDPVTVRPVARVS